MLEYCQENDVILTAYSPLARGKVMKDEVLEKIGEKYDKTPAQVSLRWLIQKDNVVAIPKSSKKKHIHENMLSLNFHLDEEDVEKIDGIKERHRCVDPDFAPW